MSGSQIAVSKPRITARGVGIAAFLWGLYTISFAFLSAQFTYYPFTAALLSAGLANIVSGLLAIPAWYVTVRRMDEASWPRKLAAHAVIAPLFTVTWYVVVAGITSVILDENLLADGDMWFSSQMLMLSTFTEYALLFSVLHGVRTVQRLRAREKQTIELLALARERELAALKAQINPHFLFNTLNTISATVTRDAEATRAMIGRLSTMLRYAIDSSSRRGVSLREEVAFAKDYLELERSRFSDRLHVCYDIEEAALDARVPPVLLQPLVENAVRHGIAPSETGGTVELRITLTADGLHVCVQDDGVGPQPTSNEGRDRGIGLQNTDARLQRTFGTEAGLHTRALRPHGFRAWFDIPHEKLEWATEQGSEESRALIDHSYEA